MSSKAWNTNGSLISFDLNINTHLLLSKMSLLSPDGADSEELPGEGVLLVLDHVTADLHRQPRPVGHLDVPGDGERSEALQMSEMTTLDSWTLSLDILLVPDGLLRLVVRHAVHPDRVHPGSGEVLTVENREASEVGDEDGFLS